MELSINNMPDVFLDGLNEKAQRQMKFLIFDIVVDSNSELFVRNIKDRYEVGFSRPIFFNPIKINLFDYKFVFTVERTNDELRILGKIRLKAYFLFFLILFFFALMRGFVRTPTDWFFFGVLPLLAVSYLVIEYFLFKKKIKLLFENQTIIK